MTARSIEHAARDPLAFEPVPRMKARADGWTEERQRAFIEALAATGSVRTACASVGLQFAGAYKLRNAPGAGSFRAAWDAAVIRGTDAVRDLLIDHSLNGVPEPVYHAGKLVGEKRKFNHRSMMWLVDKGDRLRGSDGQSHAAERMRAAQKERDAVAQEWSDIVRKWHHEIACIIASDPLYRLAYEVLYGEVDWDNLDPNATAHDGIWQDSKGKYLPGPPPYVLHTTPPLRRPSIGDIYESLELCGEAAWDRWRRRIREPEVLAELEAREAAKDAERDAAAPDLPPFESRPLCYD